MQTYIYLILYNYYFITLFEIFEKFFRFARPKFARFWLKIRDSRTSPSSSRHLPGLSVGPLSPAGDNRYYNARQLPKNNKMKIPTTGRSKIFIQRSSRPSQFMRNFIHKLSTSGNMRKKTQNYPRQ